MSIVSQEGRKLLWITLFGIAFALVESSVVVYLRALYYPEGFSFPLKVIDPGHLTVELAREAATMVMLVAVGVLAGSNAWGKFAYYMVGFGVWDIFYYIWLKVMISWPVGLTDADILFLIPLPWIGPVIAPVLISLMMMIAGLVIIFRLERHMFFRPGLLSWGLSVLGTALVLYSFMEDARVDFQQPAPYPYALLVVSLVLFAASLFLSCRGPRTSTKS